MSGQKMHLLFTGLGAGNIGDEAMFLAFLQYIRLPAGSTVEVYDPSGPVVRLFPPFYTYLAWNDDPGIEQSLKKSRVALLVGGTPVAAEWGLAWPMAALARRLRFCHDEGIPVHAVGVGADRLVDPEARRIFDDAFREIAGWSVRTARCREALLDLGVPDDRIMVGADLAWLFPWTAQDRPWAKACWQSLGVDPSRPLLGVNVVNERWAKDGDVKAVLAQALDRLSEAGAQVAFLCNETRGGEYYDACAAGQVIGLMRRPAVLLPNHYYTPSQMLSLLAFCTATLSQRYHFTIFSILAGTASVSFARGQKMTSLLEDLGEEPVGTMESCDQQRLLQQLGQALSNSEAIRKRQREHAACLQARAINDLTAVNRMTPRVSTGPRLASVNELKSAPFKAFMDTLNDRARTWGLRTFTDWSKVWEYPWIWFHGLCALAWPGLRALDLGSELSPMPWYFGKLGASVTLAEQNPQWLPAWERLVLDTGLPVDWHILADERLPFPDGSFDLVTSFSVIEHQQDKSLAVQEIARVLKPGGLFAVSFDICEPGMGMTFPDWNGNALTMKAFEELVWNHPAFDSGGQAPDWNVGDCRDFIAWNLQAAPHHNYTVGAAILRKK